MMDGASDQKNKVQLVALKDEPEIDENVSNAKIRLKRSEVEDLVAKKMTEKEKKAEKERQEQEKKEKAELKAKEKMAEKQKQMIAKAKKERAKLTAKKKAPLEKEETPLDEGSFSVVTPVIVQSEVAEPPKASRWRLPWKKKEVRRIQTVAANSRMAIPGRFLRIPPNLKLSRKDLRLARAFVQFPPPTAYPFKAGWPWTVTGEGHNVIVADSDCEEALRRQQRRNRVWRKLTRQPRNAALAEEFKRLDRPGHSFFERHASKLQPSLEPMPTLVTTMLKKTVDVEMTRKERKKYLNMPLSMCPKEELRRWCQARKPSYLVQDPHLNNDILGRHQRDWDSDSDVSDEEVEFFLAKEARECVQRVRRKAEVGKGCAKMMHRLLERFEGIPSPLAMPIHLDK